MKKFFSIIALFILIADSVSAQDNGLKASQTKKGATSTRTKSSEGKDAIFDKKPTERKDRLEKSDVPVNNSLTGKSK